MKKLVLVFIFFVFVGMLVLTGMEKAYAEEIGSITVVVTGMKNDTGNVDVALVKDQQSIKPPWAESLTA